jgi:hypothetical protein
MNTTTTDITPCGQCPIPSQCLNTKDGLTIASGVISLLLIISEILPYFKPRDNYNGLIQSIQNILQEQLRRQNQILHH